MGKLTDRQDAYGHAVYDAYQGRGGAAVGERDDGHVAIFHPRYYLSSHKDWSPAQRKALRLVKGKVIDVGCSGGRIALYLQQKGYEVVGIDNSPLSIKVCRRRGLEQARLMGITELSPRLGTFDTVVMFGNNFGLFGNFKRARWLLRRLRGMTTDTARILAETFDPYQTRDPDHLSYHRRNRRRGRMGGQIRLRVRYKGYATPWLDYLFVSKKEMHTIVADTGWRVARFIDAKGPGYIAVIEKES